MTVHLVGVGPGDAELMTLKAARLLGEADAVVYDRLIGDDILHFVSPSAERYDVGKTPGIPGPTQDDINALLIDLGHRLDCVVRIKGGDPSIFGRGAEEADACHAAGVSTTTVPGISSSIAAPTGAGVSVTRRGISSGYCVITAHQDPASSPINWPAVASCGLTIVILMGATRADRISTALIACGRQPTTPVAVITNATTANENVERLSLDQLGATPVSSPSVIVVGEVAAHELSTLATEHRHGASVRG